MNERAAPPAVPDSSALHTNALVMDAASFFLTGYDDDISASGVDCLSIMAPWPADGFEAAVARIEDYRRLAAAEPRFVIVDRADDIPEAKRHAQVAIVLGAQDSLFIGHQTSRLETFHRLGLRYMQLTYNDRNLVGDGCAEPTDAGLSRFGRELVKAMPGAGIVMDVSHAGVRTALEALRLTAAPAIASHSNPRTLYPNARNLSDDVIRAIADSGGVVGCTLPGPFNYSGGDHLPTLEDFARAIEFVIDLVGEDHVAIGSDLVATSGAYHPDLSSRLRPDLFLISGSFYNRFGTDPSVRKVQGISALREYPVLTQLLVQRGHSEDRIRKILGLNLLRVYRQVEAQSQI